MSAIILPLVVVHNPAKLQQQLEDARKAIQVLSYDQLEELFKKTVYFNSGVKEAEPWMNLISDEMNARTDLVELLKEFAMAHKGAEGNTRLLLVDHVKYQDECMRRMDRVDKALDALLALSRPLPRHAPHQLTDYLNANDDKGCPECWLSSAGGSHKECATKISRWFRTRDALVEHGIQLR